MVRLRFMRVMVFFDLPTKTSKDIRNYNRFRHFLLDEGFVMMQESVYSKITTNGTGADTVIRKIRGHRPPDGIVEVLTITETQFQGIEYIVGECQTEIVDSQERFVLL